MSVIQDIGQRRIELKEVLWMAARPHGKNNAMKALNKKTWKT